MPIICNFDTNAHSYLADRHDFDIIIAKLNGRKQQLVPHLSFINFFEYLKMVKDDQSLRRSQEYIKKFRSITLGGSILPTAKLHVQAAAGVFGTDRLIEDVKELLTAMNVFLKLNNFEEFEEVVSPTLQNDVKRIGEIVSGYNQTNAPLLDILKKARIENQADSYKRWLSLNAHEEYVKAFIAGAVRRFGLSLDQYSGDVNAMFEALPSIRYYASVYLHYVRHQILNNRICKNSDFLDLEQVAYLNVADYFVTRDSFLRDLINGCGEKDLKGRAITPEGFVQMMERETIGPRAPQTGSSMKI